MPPPSTTHPPDPPLTPLAALGSLVLCTLFLIGGGALTWLGSQAIVNTLRLSATGATALATVTDSRVMRGSRSGLDYEVRYAFSVPGDPTRYTHEDETGRADLWATLIDEPAWQQATATRSLAIVYLPSNPHVSHPVQGTTASFGGDQIAGLGLGLCLFVPSLLVFFGVILGQLRRLRAPPPSR